MPLRSQLPDGAHRVFVGSLHGLYRAAGEPTLSKIVDTINADEEREGTASRETVRRLLQGETLGSWQTTRTVFEALCSLAGLKSSDEIWDEYGHNRTTRLRDFKQRWNAAVHDDEDDAVQLPQEALPPEPPSRHPAGSGWGKAQAGDPWVTGNEPPF